MTITNKYNGYKEGSKMTFRKVTNKALIAEVEMERSGIGYKVPKSGLVKLASGISKPYNNPFELHGIIKNSTK